MKKLSTEPPKKLFSSLGLLLLISSIVIFGVQLSFMQLSKAIPAIHDNDTYFFLISMLPMYVIAFPIIFLLFKLLPAQDLGEKKKMKPLHILCAFLISYAGTYICNLLGTMITSIIGAINQKPVDNVVMSTTSIIHPAATFLIFVIGAPIMEELLFRKVLISRTIKYGEGISAVFSGLVFAFFHGNINQFVYAFLLGILFSFFYMKTRNIFYPILLHMIINFLGSFVGSIIIKATGYDKLMEVISSGADEMAILTAMTENAVGIILFFAYAMALLGLVLAGIIIYIVNRKKFTFSAGEIVIEKGTRAKTMLINLGMILYMVFWMVQIVLQLFQ